MNVEPLIINPNDQKIDELNTRINDIENNQSYIKKQIHECQNDIIDYSAKADDLYVYQLKLEKKIDINKKLYILLIVFTLISIIFEIIIMVGGK